MRSIPLFLAPLVVLACVGPSDRDDGDPFGLDAEREFVEPEPDAPQPIGFFLTEFDASLRAWTRLKLTARSDRDQRTLRALETDLGKRSRQRYDELLEQLEEGPPRNRSVAAVALGFAGDPRGQGPLLSALSSPNAELVGNALLGLGLLGRADTPIASICFHLRGHPDPWTRNNAAYALQRVVAAGARHADALDACREVLVDDEPGVRAQAATVLGMLDDVASIEPIGDMLYDDVRLVSEAATASLGRLGRTSAPDKGKVARLLVEALERVSPSRRERVRFELSLLSGRNFGDDAEGWREWAWRLP